MKAKYTVNLLFLVVVIQIFAFFLIFDRRSSKTSAYGSAVTLLKPSCKCQRNEYLILKSDRLNSLIYLQNVEFNSSDLVLTFPNSEFNHFGFTCDIYNELRRGPNQKIISYSLYGLNSRYYEQLSSIVLQAKKLYPGWTIRIYHDQSINFSALCDLKCQYDSSHVDLCDITRIYRNFSSFKKGDYFNASYIHGMKWRMLPLGDSFVDIFSSRDTDSFILDREVTAVGEWLQSGKFSHIMRGFEII
jgi:hypothetical protein